MEQILDFEEHCIEFMIKNRKWDAKKRQWKYPSKNQYHMKVKTIWVVNKRGFFNKEKQEKGFWQNIFDGYEMGPELFPCCQLCGIKLDKIRSAQYPELPRCAQKFCCKTHMIEYAKRKKIHKEKFGENSVFIWPTREGERVFRNEIKVSKIQNGTLEEIPLNANKSKFDSKR